MAVTKLQANIIDKVADISLKILSALEEVPTIAQYFSAEGIANLTIEDMSTLPELAHMTPAELAAARNALSELYTAGGGYATGTIMTRLSKVTKNLP